MFLFLNLFHYVLKYLQDTIVFRHVEVLVEVVHLHSKWWILPPIRVLWLNGLLYYILCGGVSTCTWLS